MLRLKAFSKEKRQEGLLKFKTHKFPINDDWSIKIEVQYCYYKDFNRELIYRLKLEICECE